MTRFIAVMLRLLGAQARVSKDESILPRYGKDRCMTPRRYDEPDLAGVSWPAGERARAGVRGAKPLGSD